jgi:hypothetical protein
MQCRAGDRAPRSCRCLIDLPLLILTHEVAQAWTTNISWPTPQPQPPRKPHHCARDQSVQTEIDLLAERQLHIQRACIVMVAPQKASELSFLTAVHTAKGTAKQEGTSEIFACK